MVSRLRQRNCDRLDSFALTYQSPSLRQGAVQMEPECTACVWIGMKESDLLGVVEKIGSLKKAA